MSAKNIWLTGHEVELPEMLAGREHRASEQEAVRAEHPGTLVCFTLNIAGPVKVFPLAEEVFVQTTDRIQSTLWRHSIQIREKRVETWSWGWEAYFAVDGEAETTKRVLLELEEGEIAGRLFDIDVLRPDGSKVSRQDLGLPPRPCLVCGRESAACARSRAHTVEELQDKTAQLLMESLRRERISSEMIGRLCRQAMLLEVYTTPKPGLVDRNNCGAHRDMDVALFEKSTAVLESFFVRYAALGRELYEESPEEILRCIRPIGLEAEKAMFAATSGVNTHKGMIFSLGILATATGYCLARSGKQKPSLGGILETAALIAAPAWKRDFERMPEEAQRTAGERQYARYGIGGIRQEAAEGFPSVRNYSWPILSQALQEGIDYNQAGSLALLNLIAHVTDTNMIARSSREEAARLRGKAQALLTAPEGVRKSQVLALDQEFIRQNVSPGGCADLLALTYYLYEVAGLL
ncbi:MAG: triphosphoribosyl-dephospho-CoA synthase CitG [Lachnospiraceae bacterium]|nr:triphosphoribosyl-dephospho-CoA synthase CitG [Lachnospiraceae bacterium]